MRVARLLASVGARLLFCSSQAPALAVRVVRLLGSVGCYDIRGNPEAMNTVVIGSLWSGGRVAGLPVKYQC